MALGFDLESNGLLADLTEIHVLVVKDTNTKERWIYRTDTLSQGVAQLQEAPHIVGHNIIGFDIPAIQKLFPEFKPKGKVTDTLVMSRLLFQTIIDTDLGRIKAGRIPARLRGSHKLEAWGYRLGKLKDEYQGDMSIEDPAEREAQKWTYWNQDMEDYCVQDVEVTEELYLRMKPKIEEFSTAAFIEHAVADICARQERHGFYFHEDKAIELFAELQGKRIELEQQLRADIKGWYRSKGSFTPKVNSPKNGYTKDVPFTKLEYIEFNPSSRLHIAKYLKDLYGWIPEEFTDSGQPKVDESILEKLPFDGVKAIAEYLMIGKRLGQLAEGKQAWLKKVVNGRIHGQVNTNGAVTGRATHSNPNLAQVPSVKKNKDDVLLRSLEGAYGADCRELFGVPKGKVQVGADLSGIELRCLAHYMARWDNGEYGKVILEGDIHTVNQKAAGLATRAAAKTFIYAFLYGAGDKNLGYQLLTPEQLRAVPTQEERDALAMKTGRSARRKFMKGLPAMKNLIERVQELAKERGFLIGLDGRKLHCRSPHSALNTLLQSAGALVAKQALIEFDNLVADRGWSDRVHQVAWIHDEIQVETDPELAEEVGKLCLEAFKRAGEFFNFRIRIDGEYKIGNNWCDCH